MQQEYISKFQLDIEYMCTIYSPSHIKNGKPVASLKDLVEKLLCNSSILMLSVWSLCNEMKVGYVHVWIIEVSICSYKSGKFEHSQNCY